MKAADRGPGVVPEVVPDKCHGNRVGNRVRVVPEVVPAWFLGWEQPGTALGCSHNPPFLRRGIGNRVRREEVIS